MEAFDGFDWDHGNLVKCQKHGVSVATIERLFASEIAVLPDVAHSKLEQRFKAIGKSSGNRGVLIVFTLRGINGKTFIRPISARYMHVKEVQDYEKAIAGIE